MRSIRAVVFFMLTLILTMQSLAGFDTGKKPLKAAGLSLVIPGGGQAYNEAWIKAGVVFAAEGWLFYDLYHNNDKANEYYDLAMESTGSTFEVYRSEYNKYYDRRQNDLWWIGTVVLLSMADAYVDAHLYNYEEQRSKIRLLFGKDKVQLQWRF